jgi:hypothetical protein
MNLKILRAGIGLIFVAVTLSAAAFAQSAGASRVSGSYEVVKKAEIGPDARVRLKLHLVNHEARDLHIQRLTLADFSHSGKGGTLACSIVLGAQAAADTTQEFIIRREEYELWKRGTRPRMVLQLQNQNGQKATEVIRLDHISSGREN